MKFKFLLIILLNLFVIKAVHLDTLINKVYDPLNEILNKIELQKILSSSFINDDGDDEFDFIIEILNFINDHTNISQAKNFGDLYHCGYSLFNESTNYYHNYLISLAFSGKDLSDFGMEQECLRADFYYYLITYEYFNGPTIRQTIQKNSFMFFQQNTFYTGICLPKVCHPILTFLFNKTLDPALYTFIRENLNLTNARVYSVGNLNKSYQIDPAITYDRDGRYNERKTKNELFKKKFYYIFIAIIISILIIQLFIGVIIHLFYNPFIKKTHQLKIEKEEENESQNEESEEDPSPQLFGEIKTKTIYKKKWYEKTCCKILFNYLSMFDNIKILLQKKNRYFDSRNLEIITYLRIIAIILMTFINNFEVLIKIPSRYFFYEIYYTGYQTFFLKFASFSVDIWLSLDGFESMYKLINFYKKYIFNKQGKRNTLLYLFKFYLCSIYKLVSFILFFLIVNYLTKYFIYSLSSGALFEYYANHIYYDRLDEEKMFKFLIPGYSLYYFYYNKCSIFFEDIIISKYSLIFINEFYAYTLFLIIFYLSDLFKSKIFDYIIVIINFFLYFFNYWIVEFKSDDLRPMHYSYKLVFDNFITARYPHIVFNFFFLGALSGLICFYYKDIFSKNSICSGNNKFPFKLCYKSIKIFDCLIQKGRKFWIFLFTVIQILISLSFYFLVKLNDNSIFIPFKSLQKFVLCYESGLFVFLFCINLILIFFIRSENEGKEKNNSSIIYLIERTSFSFYHTINLLMYISYCFFNFQVKLNIQNLFIVTFALFFIVLFENLLLTLAFVFPFKILNRYIIKKFLKENKNEIISQPSEILTKSLVRESIDSNTPDNIT